MQCHPSLRSFHPFIVCLFLLTLQFAKAPCVQVAYKRVFLVCLSLHDEFVSFPNHLVHVGDGERESHMALVVTQLILFRFIRLQRDERAYLTEKTNRNPLTPTNEGAMCLLHLRTLFNLGVGAQ